MRGLLTLSLSLALLGGAQVRSAQEPRYAAPEPMPQDRIDDSYTIYSMLLTDGPIEWRDAPRKQWLIEETTQAARLESPCNASGASGEMTPHNAVEAPRERSAQWQEVLDDFDRHCHDRLKLQADEFHVHLPVHLLDEAAQARYQGEQGGRRKEDAVRPLEFPDGAGLHRFTEVYFDAHHTLAAVEQGMWCGMLCGNWSWVVLERRDGAWHMLPWVHTFAIS